MLRQSSPLVAAPAAFREFTMQLHVNSSSAFESSMSIHFLVQVCSGSFLASASMVYEIRESCPVSSLSPCEPACFIDALPNFRSRCIYNACGSSSAAKKMEEVRVEVL